MTVINVQQRPASELGNTKTHAWNMSGDEISSVIQESVMPLIRCPHLLRYISGRMYFDKWENLWPDVKKRFVLSPDEEAASVKLSTLFEQDRTRTIGYTKAFYEKLDRGLIDTLPTKWVAGHDISKPIDKNFIETLTTEDKAVFVEWSLEVLSSNPSLKYYAIRHGLRNVSGSLRQRMDSSYKNPERFKPHGVVVCNLSDLLEQDPVGTRSLISQFNPYLTSRNAQPEAVKTITDVSSMPGEELEYVIRETLIPLSKSPFLDDALLDGIVFGESTNLISNLRKRFVLSPEDETAMAKLSNLLKQEPLKTTNYVNSLTVKQFQELKYKFVPKVLVAGHNITKPIDKAFIEGMTAQDKDTFVKETMGLLYLKQSVAHRTVRQFLKDTPEPLKERIERLFNYIERTKPMKPLVDNLYGLFERDPEGTQSLISKHNPFKKAKEPAR